MSPASDSLPDPHRWAQVQDVFASALHLARPARTTFLDQACASDPTLRSEVEALLAADEEAGDFLAATVGGGTILAEPPDPDRMGERIGPYRIERELGRGGMSTVYLAVRDDDEYRQSVALKLLRPGMDSEDILRRFRRERQILANLDHPHIARLLDGGTAPDGRPYFVLEAIEGVPIDEHCDRNRLSIAERLALFRTVCAAVAAAHRSLIVHRDLKPSNILVTADGTPKLLDFGIAKLLSPDLPDLPADATATAVRVLTPGYASPEQIRGEPVTTASDVYSLGVLLHELLTGRKPGKAPEPAKEQPAKPSSTVLRKEEIVRRNGQTALLTPEGVAEARSAQPRELRRRLAGDLDTIVLTALRAEPSRRYGSAEQLSEDVRRHLASQPVAARRATAAYRAGKFLRRNRTALAVGGVLLGMILAFMVATTMQSQRTALERDKAEKSLAFLVDLFEVADPGVARGDEITAREILDRGAARVDRELAGQPEVQAALQQSLGRIYHELGLYERAEALFRSALAVRRRTLGGEHPEVASTLQDLSLVLQLEGKYAESEVHGREALALRRKLFGEEHPDVAASLANLADLKFDQGDYTAAEPLYRQALALRRRLFHAPHLDLASSLNDLGLLLHDQGKYEAAEPLYREALAMRRALLGEDHPDVAVSLQNLASLLEIRGKYAESEALFRRAVAIQKRVLGEGHPSLGTTLKNLGNLLYHAGKPEAAEPVLRQALAIQRAALGPDHLEIATHEHDLALTLWALGKTEEAERLFRDAIGLYRKTLPPGHPFLAHPLVALGRLLLERKNAVAAEPFLTEGLAIRRRTLPPDHWRIGEAALGLGTCRYALGRTAEAERLLVEAYTNYRRALGENHARTRKAREWVEWVRKPRPVRLPIDTRTTLR